MQEDKKDHPRPEPNQPKNEPTPKWNDEVPCGSPPSLPSEREVEVLVSPNPWPNPWDKKTGDEGGTDD